MVNERIFNLVNNMTKSTAYPSGKPYWDISSKIVKSNMHPFKKINLLMDCYSRYYIFQHKKCVNFDVLETFYEEITRTVDGFIYQDNDKYNEKFKLLDALTSHLVNLNLKENLLNVFRQISQSGLDITKYYQSLDELSRQAIKFVLKKVGVHAPLGCEGQVFEVNESDNNLDNRIKDLLTQRYEKLNKENINK